MNFNFERNASAVVMGLAVASAAVAPANAAIVKWTFSGQVAEGFDTTGVFGAANTVLSGDPFSITYTFDTSKGALSQGPGYSFLQGGAAPTGPFSAATLTINGVGVSISGVTTDPSSDFATTNDSTISGAVEAAIGGGDLNTSYSYAFNAIVGLSDASASFDTAHNSTGLPTICLDSTCNDLYSGSFGINESSTRFPDAYGLFGLDQTTKIVATVSGVGAVPEPATWALMLIGFSGVGAAIRRSRRRTSLASTC